MNTKKPRLSYWSTAAFGLFAMVALLGGSFAWAYSTSISSAVISTGSVVVAGKPKSIQHLDGGIVQSLHVTSGQKVQKGQTLVELDGTIIRASLAIYTRRLREAIVRRERLRAELKGQSTFAAPIRLAQLLGLGNLSDAVEQQKELLVARRSTRAGQLSQYDEKIAQSENQIDGLEGLKNEKAKQISSFAKEIASVQNLIKAQLAAKSVLLGLERQRDSLKGEMSSHSAEIARLKNAISETRIAKLQVDREFRESVIAEIEKTESQIDELSEQIQATRKQFGRIKIKAPVDGIIHELNLFTIGGVVQPGQVVMQIIPQTNQQEIELNVQPQHIDQIRMKQRVILRFPAFHERTTPQLDGSVSSVSPTSVVDKTTGARFYRVGVNIKPIELKRLGDNTLVPGMPVEGFVPTKDRSVLSYIMKPLIDHITHALREE